MSSPLRIETSTRQVTDPLPAYAGRDIAGGRYVVLRVADTAELSVHSLSVEFGTYTLLPGHWDDLAPSIKFYLGEPAEIGSSSIIATLTPGDWENIDDGSVSELTLQPEF